MYIMHEFETCVGPLDVIGVEFRRLGNNGGKWRTLTHDSDHAECEGVSGVDSAI